MPRFRGWPPRGPHDDSPVSDDLPPDAWQRLGAIAIDIIGQLINRMATAETRDRYIEALDELIAEAIAGRNEALDIVVEWTFTRPVPSRIALLAAAYAALPGHRGDVVVALHRAAIRLGGWPA